MAVHDNLTYTSGDLLWQEHAACRGPMGAVFYPPPFTERKRDRREREARAKEICQSCPVQLECREHSISEREQHGVWGGLSERERRVLLKPT